MTCPTLQAQITSPANGTYWYTTQAIPFAGTVRGACGPIPTSDLTWQAVNTATGAATQLGPGTAISMSLPVGPYTISFQAVDPTTGQMSTASIAITVTQPIG